jgi:protein-S-isoprenylcysteine O-methyltransferase
MKGYFVITVIGIVICISGDVLRKLAMFHAGRSFSHIVQSTKKVLLFLYTYRDQCYHST